MRKVWLLFFLCLYYSIVPASETDDSEAEELLKIINMREHLNSFLRYYNIGELSFY